MLTNASVVKKFRGALLDNLQSEDVLADTGAPPSCVTHHPGFRINCLEKWSVRMVASKYRTISRRRYRRTGSEEA